MRTPYLRERKERVFNKSVSQKLQDIKEKASKNTATLEPTSQDVTSAKSLAKFKRIRHLYG